MYMYDVYDQYPYLLPYTIHDKQCCYVIDCCVCFVSGARANPSATEHEKTSQNLSKVTLTYVEWDLHFTEPFNNLRTLKFKAQPTNAFSLPSIKCLAPPPSFRLLQSARYSTQVIEQISDNIHRTHVVRSWEEPLNI